MTKEQQKNIILIVIMAAVIGVTAFLLMRDTQDVTTSVNDTLNQTGTTPTIPTRIENDIFTSSEFKDLKDYSPTSFPLQPKGRDNPFVPFRFDETQEVSE